MTGSNVSGGDPAGFGSGVMRSVANRSALFSRFAIIGMAYSSTTICPSSWESVKRVTDSTMWRTRSRLLGDGMNSGGFSVGFTGVLAMMPPGSA